MLSPGLVDEQIRFQFIHYFESLSVWLSKTTWALFFKSRGNYLPPTQDFGQRVHSRRRWVSVGHREEEICFGLVRTRAF